MSTSNTPEVVVVTGASAGLGRATVREFARRGAHLGLLARGREGLERARQEVEAAGGRALVLPTDIADAEQAEERNGRLTRPQSHLADWARMGQGVLNIRPVLRRAPARRIGTVGGWLNGN